MSENGPEPDICALTHEPDYPILPSEWRYGQSGIARPAVNRQCSIALLRVATFVLTFAPGAVLAQAPTGSANDALLQHLVGRWVASGTIANKRITHDVEGSWVLAHRYLLIHEVSRETNAQGGPQYEAFVYIAVNRPAAGEYTCLWLDSTSDEGLTNGTSCVARLDGDSIPFVLSDRSGRVDFTTTFAYDRARDTWTWSLDNIKDGKPSPFARMTLQKNGG